MPTFTLHYAFLSLAEIWHFWSKNASEASYIFKKIFFRENSNEFFSENLKFTAILFCFDLPIIPHSTADFYQNSPRFVNKSQNTDKINENLFFLSFKCSFQLSLEQRCHVQSSRLTHEWCQQNLHSSL